MLSVTDRRTKTLPSDQYYAHIIGLLVQILTSFHGKNSLKPMIGNLHKTYPKWFRMTFLFHFTTSCIYDV